MRASNEAAKSESVDCMTRGQEQRGGRSITRGSSCPALPGPTGSLRDTAHHSPAPANGGRRSCSQPSILPSPEGGQSQSAHSHFESDKPSPRFTLKNKYARPARTGVRKKQRRHGPCQLSGLIYSHSRGTGLSLARGRTQSQAGDPGRQAETRGWCWNEGHSWDAHRVLGGGVGVPSFC